ncbi:hypothetical protein DDB_G0277607 [Dictyostelium discoideum AX4]|uniref:Uncharacterized protein n=1 Tax=Dictyostelium discoideum TaxID=44689 RepID=Q86KR0_DICDI|nr:hypothetical protein DDB_G0277607 [Dictyostelium discoideum AX4]EAL68621.1 hypothetical protein DDB_G0277607 [Dictyostelium discoideum AX4]|eukprot:XP_642574.1 hypothetical protein DDB_G0277607 [Dictyostelium discoideum AX4]
MVSIDFNSSIVQNNQNNFSYPATGNDTISTTISLEKPSDNINYANEELPFRDPSVNINNNNNSRNNYRNNNNSNVYRNNNTTTTTTTTTTSSNSRHSVSNQGVNGGLSRRTKFRIISTIISLVICIVVLVIYFGKN